VEEWRKGSTREKGIAESEVDAQVAGAVEKGKTA